MSARHRERASNRSESSETKLTFNSPVLGCSPRPLNNPGGSTLKFPTFSFLPSSKHVLYGASTTSRSALMAFFCAVVSSFFLAFSPSR